MPFEVFITLFGLPIALLISGVVNLILFLTSPKESKRRKGTKIAMIVSFSVFGIIAALLTLLFIVLMIGVANM